MSRFEILSVSKRLVEKSSPLVKFWKLSSEGMRLSSFRELTSRGAFGSVVSLKLILK